MGFVGSRIYGVLVAYPASAKKKNILVRETNCNIKCKMEVKVKIKKLSPEAVMPSKGTDKSAGYDLTAISAFWDKERNQVKYFFGLAFEIPVGYTGLIFPRSSVCKKDLSLSNCVGVIDSDYRGEVTAVFNVTDTSKDNVYSVGDRIAQMVFMKLPEVELTEVEELSETKRGTGGYGSTGK